MVFIYDASGSPIGFQYRNEETYEPGVFVTYWYIKNLQGDIVAVSRDDGVIHVSYTYDAWGNVTTTYLNGGYDAAAYFNPFKYRGYYHDSETGFYYLNSRYYDPATGRFLNADNNFSNTNLFMYCSNNIVNAVDSNGEHWYYLWIDDLFQAVDELMACVTNIVYGQYALAMSLVDPIGALELWNSRPFQDIQPSTEMQIFTEIIYHNDYVFDASVTYDINEYSYIKLGVTELISPAKDTDATYVHVGLGTATPSLLPVNVSCSFGRVTGVYEKSDYSGSFLYSGVAAVYGVEYSFWPNGSSAYSFTISTSYGVYSGYDYYWCID